MHFGSSYCGGRDSTSSEMDTRQIAMVNPFSSGPASPEPEAEGPEDAAGGSEQQSPSVDWSRDLLNAERRDCAILELCKNSDVIDNIGNILWRSPSIMTVLLGELVKVYPLINPPNLPGNTIAKVCSITALLQRVVLDSDTRVEFLKSKIIIYLLPFLGVEGSTREMEHLRVCILSLLCTIARLLPVQQLEDFLELRHSEVFPLTIQSLRECISEVSVRGHFIAIRGSLEENRF